MDLMKKKKWMLYTVISNLCCCHLQNFIFLKADISWFGSEMKLIPFMFLSVGMDHHREKMTLHLPVWSTF